MKLRSDAVGYTAPRGGVPDSLKLSAVHDCSAVAAFMKTVATFVNMRTPKMRQSLYSTPKHSCVPVAAGQLDLTLACSRAHSSETHSKTVAMACCGGRPRLMAVSKLVIRPLFSSSVHSISEGNPMFENKP